MLRRLFLDHPAAVGESYVRHFGVASSFGLSMVTGGVACFIHAVVPALFQTTGSRTVIALHGRLVAMRAAARADRTQMLTVDYVI